MTQWSKNDLVFERDCKCLAFDVLNGNGGCLSQFTIRQKNVQFRGRDWNAVELLLAFYFARENSHLVVLNMLELEDVVVGCVEPLVTRRVVDAKFLKDDLLEDAVRVDTTWPLKLILSA